jgi:hypothetical protein
VSNPTGATGFTLGVNVRPNSFLIDGFSLDDGESKTFEVSPGTYVVTEDDPVAASGGLHLTSLVCTDSDQVGTDSTTDVEARAATINLDPLESVVCTFTNTPVGSITITKSALPADGADFGFTGDLGGFTLDDAVPDDADSFGHSLTFNNLPIGQYQV